MFRTVLTAQSIKPFDGVLDLRRRCDGSLDKRVTFVALTEMLAQAIVVEAILTAPAPVGRIKYLREIDSGTLKRQAEPPAASTHRPEPLFKTRVGLSAALKPIQNEQLEDRKLKVLRLAIPIYTRRGVLECYQLVDWKDGRLWNPLRYNPDPPRPIRGQVGAVQRLHGLHA